MSTKLSSATALHEVRAASAATATGVSKGGPTETVGSTVIANAQAGSDRILYYVNSSGDAIASSGPLYQPESTDVAVTVPEGSGDQTWVYVQAGNASIARGDVVSLAADCTYGPFDPVAVTGGVASGGASDLAATKVAGVAQHNIPAQSFAWILVKGVGIAKVVAATAAGTELKSDGSTLNDGLGPAGANNKGIGVTAEAGVAAGSLVKLDI